MRKVLLLSMMAALMLPACADLSQVPTSPGQIADQTKFDEVGVIALAKSVEIAANLAKFAIQAGAIKGAGLDTSKELVGKARTVLKVVQTSYEAGNRGSFFQAASDLNVILASINSLANGGSN